MRERWIEIEEFPRYAVSNCGRVYDRLNDRILDQTPDRNGYHRVKIVTPMGRMTVSVHRLVAGAFYDVDISNYEVNHDDGDKSNNHLWNLEVTNRSGNMKHAYANGLVHLPKETGVICVETQIRYRTMRAAARAIGCADHKAIARVVDNPNRTAKGYHFISSKAHDGVREESL